MTARVHRPVPGSAGDLPGATDGFPSPRSPASAASSADTLPIAETFVSIQGEGKLAGVPSYFVRVSGCHLRCTWCDTPHASWFPEGQRVAVADVARAALESRLRHAVLTGGEPMLFAALEPLADALHAGGMHITIETAGTIFRPVACDLMSLSPKLSHSTPAPGDPRDPAGTWRRRHEQRRLNLPALQALLDAFPCRQLKFVVARPGDFAEIEALLDRLHGWTPDDVLVMPEGTAPPSRPWRLWLVGQCLRRGWRYCPRLHIELFGHRRGT